MSWTETPVVLKKVGPAGRVTFKANSGRMIGAQVGLPATVVETLGWKDGERLRLLVGGAEHADWLRFEPAAKGEIVFFVFTMGPASKSARGGAVQARHLPAPLVDRDREGARRTSHYRQGAGDPRARRRAA